MMKVHFLNVGHGDCTIIEHPSGRVTVIDINNAQTLDAQSTRAIVESFNFSISEETINRITGKNTAFQFLSERGYDIQLTDPIAYLKQLLPNRTIFRYIQTHPDLDHMRGLTGLQQEFEILNFWDTSNTKSDPEFRGEADRQDWETYQRLRRSKASPKGLYFNRNDSRPHFGP